jgi:hypothetical protein
MHPDARRQAQPREGPMPPCFERIVPAFKVEVRDTGEHRNPSELSDQEIIETMERMVNLAQGAGGNQLPSSSVS